MVVVSQASGRRSLLPRLTLHVPLSQIPLYSGTYSKFLVGVPGMH